MAASPARGSDDAGRSPSDASAAPGDAPAQGRGFTESVDGRAVVGAFPGAPDTHASPLFVTPGWPATLTRKRGKRPMAPRQASRAIRASRSFSRS